MDTLGKMFERIKEEADAQRGRLTGWRDSLSPKTERMLQYSLIGLTALVILLVISSIWIFQILVGPGRLLVEGNDAFWQSKLSEAERVYNRVLATARMRPQQTDAYIGLCRLYAYQEKYDDALEACQAAVQSDVNSAQAEAETARTYNWMGSYEEAVFHAQLAIRLDPQEPVALAFFAEVLANAGSQEAGKDNNGDFTRALTLAQQAFALDPTNPETYRVLGAIYHVMGEFGEAAAYYQQATQIRPSFFAFYSGLGDAETGRGNHLRAVEAYSRALTLQPENMAALRGRGWAWWSSGDYENARQDFRKAIRLNPQDSNAWTGLGWSYYHLESYEEARRAFEQALSLDPENQAAQSGLNSLEIASGAAAPDVTAESEALEPDDVAEMDAVEGDIERPLGDWLEDAIAAAVQVYAFDANYRIAGECSGVLIAPEGFVLTSSHCLLDPGTGKPYHPERVIGIGIMEDPRLPPVPSYRAALVALEETLDVAVMQIYTDWEGNQLAQTLDLPVVPIGNSDAMQVGDQVWTVGFPGMGGDTLTITGGLVSGFSERDGTPWIKTDLMSGPGNSGGMVLNNRGELIGLHTQSWSDAGQASSRLSVERPINSLRHLFEGLLD